MISKGFFGVHAAQMREIYSAIVTERGQDRVIWLLCKALRTEQSDVGLAVFLQSQDARLLAQYRQLARICVNFNIDIKFSRFLD